MINLYRRAGIFIPKKYKNLKFYSKVKSNLIRRSKNYNSSDYTTTKFYAETSDFLIIPRYFPIKDYVECNIIDKYDRSEDILIEHNIKFRNDLQKRAAKHMMENESGVIELNPGTGKTVITIYMICERKKKSLILVHKDYLATQWRNRFLEHSNISKENIVRITSSNFKKAFQKPILIITDQTFLSMINRNKEEFLKELNKANIGIFISDECHTSSGAPSFSQCALRVPAKINYGLSATPYRFDGNSDIINYHLGKVFTDESTEGTMPAKVTAILTDYKIDIPYRKKYIWWEGEFQRSRYLNLLRKSKNVISIAKGVLNKFKNSKKILFMSERINLIDQLYKWLNSPSKGKFIGGSKDSELEKSIIFSTPGKVRDGVDVPDIDCLIMTSPISNIKQMCGRATRQHEGKETPIIIDMVDYGCSEMSGSFYRRLDFYETKEWEINFLLYYKNKLIKIDEEQVLEILMGI